MQSKVATPLLGVLIVEDNESLQETLYDTLSEEGFDPVACRTGAEALALAEQSAFAVAIVDLRLPDIDGTTLLEGLERVQPGIKSIIHTGYGSFASAKEAINRGAFAYVEKIGGGMDLMLYVHRAARAWTAAALQALEVRHTRELEDRVRRRTEELEEKNAELAVKNEDLKREITERKQAEEALRQSEERLRLVLDATNDGVWDWNIKTGEVHFSPHWEKSLGYAEGEVPPHVSFWEQTVHPDDMPHLQRVLQKHLDGETAYYEFENRLRMKNGTYRWNLDRGEIVEWDSDGKPLRMVGTDTDITKRKQAEEALRTTQEYLDTILLNMPVGVAILEGPDFRYYRINHRLAEMNGLSVEEHLDRPLAAVLPDAAPDIIPGLREVLETGQARLNREFSTQLPKDPAVTRHFIDSFFPIKGADGKPRAVGAVVLDITARKRAEEAHRRLSQRLVEVLEAERLHIARELHDEIGQVLTGIKFGLQVARGIPGATTLLPNLEDMICAAERAYQQVHDLALDLRPSVLNDLGLVPALRWFCERYTVQTNIDVDFHHEIPHATRFDPKVEITAFRIIQEALTNVARHADVRAVQVFVRRESEHLVLHVIDQGRGFDATTDLARRDALGLFGMNERIVLLGGSLKIESSPDTGTRISARLPLG